uniref:Large ribosomal subunit protein uL4c n=1 Tax=Dasyclonium flaccidum TaxID=2007274 RepID=A0A1Z1ML56_9FLOR|nr:ribosomal protein L4 [Dasyclonium flaccidum]ARW66666.1 ribosomal protein L4 [Dasyclonium flaccidum]
MNTIKKIQYSIKSNSTNYNSELIKDIYLNINDSQEKQIYIVHRALKQQLTNYRKRNAHTKTRSEVRGGGKKPWKQKGTGRARAGSNRSPLWKGGGIIFGPRKKIYHSKINKKEKKLALQTIIYNKFSKTIVVDKFLDQTNEPNTKNSIKELNKIGIKIKDRKKILVVTENKTKNLYLSLRNIPYIEIIDIKHINILCLLQADIILITFTALSEISQENK